MMALDGKAIIKEEIPDKDIYDSASNNRRNKGNGKDNCRTPDSPESARAIAPRSPMSPQIHHTSLAPPRPNRNASSSPIINGATTTPPPAVSAITTPSHLEQSRALSKIRKFLGSLVQFSQDTHPESSDRIRALVLSLASGGITIEEFRIALQEATNYPLRPYVIPFLKSHVPLLQREIASLARSTNQTTLQYVTTNDTCVMEFSSHGPTDHLEIFLPIETGSGTTLTNLSSSSSAPNVVAAAVTNGLLFKRRASDIGDHHSNNSLQEWSDYIYPPTKRLSHGHATSLISSAAAAAAAATGNLFSTGSNGQPSSSSLFEYQSNSISSNHNEGFGVLLDKSNHRDERDIRNSTGAGGATTDNRINRMNSGEAEWKNIVTMLNCISGMVEKTKRAITILQQRGIDPQLTNYSDITAVAEIKRQTEEKVAEFKRNAEESVNQVKRQAVIEIQRAVAAAENRAADLMAQERLKMEKFFVEMTKQHHNSIDNEADSKSPSLSAGQNSCWNCGRKANETCSGCNMARYCGAFCQHKDWEHHHQICGNVRADVTAAAAAAAAVSKHSSQTLRNQMVRSPPIPSNQQQQQQQQQSTQQSGSSQQSGVGGGSVSNTSSSVTNGVNSGGGIK